jgi:hypothetical protein
METPELLLAKELGYDCVVSHHPKADVCSWFCKGYGCTNR